MKLFSNTVKKHMPQIRILLEEQNSLNTDSWLGDTITTIGNIFNKILSDFTIKQNLFRLSDRLKHVADTASRLSITSWKRVIGQTLGENTTDIIKNWKNAIGETIGINIFEDYYNGSRFKQLFDQWTTSNVNLIKTIPQESLTKMQDIVNQGFRSGARHETIAKEIQQTYNISRTHARFIARDQTAKLNAQVTRTQHESAGIKTYIWRTTGDQRVRETHKHLNGKKFEYTNPPIVDKRTGRTANPGEDYRCRCVALPIFDIEGLVLPWEKTD